MAYCTVADVKVYVGTVVSDADLGAMITDADSEIGAFFLARGSVTPGTAAAKQASILLVRAKVAERFNVTGENPTSFSYPDYSQSGVSDHFTSGKDLADRAYQIMRDELNRQDVPYMAQEDIQRADAVMPDFKLDQSDLPEFYTETDAPEDI